MLERDGLNEECDIQWENSNYYRPEVIEAAERKINKKRVKKEKRIRRAILVFVVFCCMFFIYEIIGVVLVKTRNIMPNITYDIRDKIYVQQKLREEYLSIRPNDMTVQDIKAQSAKEVPLFWCIQIDVDYLGDKGGVCSFLIGLIQIKTNQKITNYDLNKNNS